MGSSSAHRRLSPDPISPRTYVIAVAALTVLAATVRFAALSRPLPALDGRSIPDDTYLALEIAKHIGQGKGPIFVDKYTNGFQPLFVWLASIPFVFLDATQLTEIESLDRMVKFALGIGVMFDLGSLLLLTGIVRRGTGSRGAAIFAACAWSIQPGAIRISLNGLETSTAIFFFLLVWRLTLTRPLATAAPRRLFVLGLVIGVGAMARIDVLVVGVYFAIVSLAALAATRFRGPALRDWFIRNLALGGGTLLGYLPWVLYSYAYTRLLFPISGKAVRWISLTNANHDPGLSYYARMMTRGVNAVIRNTPNLIITALVVMAAAVTIWALRKGLSKKRPELFDGWARRRSWAWLDLPATHAVCLFFAYTLYVFAPWFFPRYLFPLVPLVVGVSAMGVTMLMDLAGTIRPWVRSAALAAACAATLLYSASHPRTHTLLFSPPNISRGYRNLGIWANEYFPEGTVVGSSQTGALGYYATRIRVVNLDGVVNQEAYFQIVAKKNMAYIRAESIDYVLGWRTNLRFIERNSTDYTKFKDLRYMGKVKGFKSWGNFWRLYEVTYPRDHPKHRKARLPPARWGQKAASNR